MNHQQTGRDLIVISDWMCARFVRLGWVQEMDRAKQPNVTKYLDPLLRSPAFDPGRKSTVPWQSGITGIAYNRRKVGREIKHVSDLWADDLKGRVTLLSGLDEAFALLMQGNGVDITKWTADDFHQVCDQVEKVRPQRPDPALHRQRLHQGPVQRRRPGLPGVLRRRDPAPGRRPRHPLRRPRGGRRTVGRVPDDPQPGPPQGQRGETRRLLLRARGRRRTRRVGQLRLPRPGRPGRPRLRQGRGDRRPRRGPADLPGHRHAQAARDRARHHVRRNVRSSRSGGTRSRGCSRTCDQLGAAFASRLCPGAARFRTESNSGDPSKLNDRDDPGSHALVLSKVRRHGDLLGEILVALSARKR